MPVTIQVANHAAKPWSASPPAPSSAALLKGSCSKEHAKSKRIVQSSFDDAHTAASPSPHISASPNGFFWAAYHAYSTHHHLTLRPDDVWFAILTQLSLHVNANAEALRAHFVAHAGRKELEVVAAGSAGTVDFGALARRMTDLIAKNVVDPGLRDWVMPAFSTTTEGDGVVAAVLFMGAMQKYFEYKMSLMCGIPSVTLLGEVGDWEMILARLDKLDALGEEPARFAEMLRPVVRRLVRSFEDPGGEEVVEFWNTIAAYHPMMSGTPYVSGWLAAFCFWDEEGRARRCRGEGEEGSLVLDGVCYPTVDIDSVPVGFSSVPVLVDDNGRQMKTTMVAGSVGIRVSSRGEEGGAADASAPPLDTVQPESGWWMYENLDKGDGDGQVSEDPAASQQISPPPQSPVSPAGTGTQHPIETEEVEIVMIETPS